MSKRTDIKSRLHALGEIRSILSAMKNLSIIEANKVTRYLGAQNEMAAALEEALGDFEHFYGQVADGGRESGVFEKKPMLYVLLGSERGFCGGFNEAVLKKFDEIRSQEKTPVSVVVVGRKLFSKMDVDENQLRLLAAIDGPSAAEEIAGAIERLLTELERFPEVRWTLICHESSDSVEVICPFNPKSAPFLGKEAFAPLIHLEPPELFVQLFEQYLFSILYKGFYLSFLTENRERLRHMDGALNALEKKYDRLRQLGNILRQEEITEELEVILLSE